MDTSTTIQDGKVSIRLNGKCREDPTSFFTTLTYGSCLDIIYHSKQYVTSKAFNSSGVAPFELQLDIENVIGNLCLQFEITHQSQPNNPLSIFEQKLTLNSCPVSPINSVASQSSVTVDFSLAESSGEVPHGTIATFKPLSSADQLVGAEHAVCVNGTWSDLSRRTSSCKSACCSCKKYPLLSGIGQCKGVPIYIIYISSCRGVLSDCRNDMHFHSINKIEGLRSKVV